jgi:hypothetical protein
MAPARALPRGNELHHNAASGLRLELRATRVGLQDIFSVAADQKDALDVDGGRAGVCGVYDFLCAEGSDLDIAEIEARRSELDDGAIACEGSRLGHGCVVGHEEERRLRPVATGENTTPTVQFPRWRERGLPGRIRRRGDPRGPPERHSTELCRGWSAGQSQWAWWLWPMLAGKTAGLARAQWFETCMNRGCK